MENSKIKILVGKNGTGKSKLLSSIIKNELKKSYPQKSNFERIIAISLAPFDKFPISTKNTNGRYKYLGIKNTSGESAAKKFIKKVSIDFFESINEKNNIENLIKSINSFGLRPWIKFSIKISSKIDFNKIKHYTNSEFQNYIFRYFLGENIWNKINRKYKTKDVFQTISYFQDFLNEYEYQNASRVKWIFEFSDTSNASAINSSLSYSQISILLSTGILEINEININIDNKEVNLCSASSGEQSIYLTMIGISSNITENSLILIDEPETCLHPAWQEKYISNIEIFKDNYKNCTFWIATHSPKIISGARADATIFDCENNTIYNNEIFSKQSSDYQLAELFKSPGYKNEYIIKKINRSHKHNCKKHYS